MPEHEGAPGIPAAGSIGVHLTDEERASLSKIGFPTPDHHLAWAELDAEAGGDEAQAAVAAVAGELADRADLPPGASRGLEAAPGVPPPSPSAHHVFPGTRIREQAVSGSCFVQSVPPPVTVRGGILSGVVVSGISREVR